jgi:elongation factor P
MTIGFGDLRKGLTIELDGVPYKVEDFTHVKMQQRAPTVKMKLRDLRTGQAAERSFSNYKFRLNEAPVENRPAQYLYHDGDYHYFMDLESFDQYPITEEYLGAAINCLVEQTEVELIFHRDKPISIELPTTVNLKITETPPSFKGDTAAGGTKPATLETGITIQVPMFINPGETIKVDTRTVQYVERAG